MQGCQPAAASPCRPASRPRSTSQVHCQPPTRCAIQATAGGARNCPSDEACCIRPTVVDTVAGDGASRTASMNRVAGTMPPPSENRHTASVAQRRRQRPRSCTTSPLGKGAPGCRAAIAPKPQRSNRSGATPRCSSRPPARLPTMLAAAATERSARAVQAAVGCRHRHRWPAGSRSPPSTARNRRRRPAPASADPRAIERLRSRPRQAGRRDRAALPPRVGRHRERHPDGSREPRRRTAATTSRPPAAGDQWRSRPAAPMPHQVACRRPTGQAPTSREPAGASARIRPGPGHDGQQKAQPFERAQRQEQRQRMRPGSTKPPPPPAKVTIRQSRSACCGAAPCVSAISQPAGPASCPQPEPATRGSPPRTRLMPRESRRAGTAGGSLPRCRAALTPAATTAKAPRRHRGPRALPAGALRRPMCVPSGVRARAWRSGRSCRRCSRPPRAGGRCARP